jgi:hypothetical protein
VSSPRQELPVFHFWKKTFLFTLDSHTGSFIETWIGFET